MKIPRNTLFYPNIDIVFERKTKKNEIKQNETFAIIFSVFFKHLFIKETTDIFFLFSNYFFVIIILL